MTRTGWTTPARHRDGAWLASTAAALGLGDRKELLKEGMDGAAAELAPADEAARKIGKAAMLMLDALDVMTETESSDQLPWDRYEQVAQSMGMLSAVAEGGWPGFCEWLDAQPDVPRKCAHLRALPRRSARRARGELLEESAAVAGQPLPEGHAGGRSPPRRMGDAAAPGPGRAAAGWPRSGRCGTATGMPWPGFTTVPTRSAREAQRPILVRASSETCGRYCAAIVREAQKAANREPPKPIEIEAELPDYDAATQRGERLRRRVRPAVVRDDYPDTVDDVRELASFAPHHRAG